MGQGVGGHNVSLNEETQKEVTVGYQLTNQTTEGTQTKDVYVAADDAPEAADDGDILPAGQAPPGRLPHAAPPTP